MVDFEISSPVAIFHRELCDFRRIYSVVIFIIRLTVADRFRSNIFRSPDDNLSRFLLSIRYTKSRIFPRIFKLFTWVLALQKLFFIFAALNVFAVNKTWKLVEKKHTELCLPTRLMHICSCTSSSTTCLETAKIKSEYLIV